MEERNDTQEQFDAFEELNYEEDEEDDEGDPYGLQSLHWQSFLSDKSLQMNDT